MIIIIILGLAVLSIVLYLIITHSDQMTRDYELNNFKNSKEYELARNEWMQNNDKTSLQNIPYTIAPLKGAFVHLSDKEAAVSDMFDNLMNTYIEQYDPQKGDDWLKPLTIPREPFPPSVYFPKVKQDYENTEIFRVLDIMPKGALLHIHSGAVGNLDWILEEGIFLTGDDGTQCFINTELVDSLDSYDSNIPLLFKFSINSPSDKWIPVTKEYISDNEDKIRECLTMGSSLSGASIPIAWQAFELINSRYSALRKFNKYQLASYTSGLLTLAKNGIIHVEIRLGFLTFPFNARDLIVDTIDKIQAFIAARDAVKRIYPDFTIKIILASPRTVDIETIKYTLELAYKIKSGNLSDAPGYPLPSNMVEIQDLIVGYDLIAEEDPNYKTIKYLDIWLEVPKLRETYGVFLPFFFHDGESDWITNTNVVDAVLLDSKRIGHGFNIAFFPFIKKELVERNICLEVCPLSNQLLHYFKDLRMHFANALFREGVPMAISSDDPLMYGYNGLTYDFWAAAVSWGLDLKSLKKLVYNSILYSCLSETEKIDALKVLDVNWYKWIDIVYDMYK